MTKINKKSLLLLLAFCFVFLLTRVPRLYNDVLNPDEVNWYYRTQQFVNGIKYHQWEKTYQHYHPGIILMWITGTASEIYNKIYHVNSNDIYTYQSTAFVSKFALVIVQLILTLYIIFVLRKYFGVLGSILLVSLFTFEPFFVGNSRLYHMDALLTLLVFAGLLTGFLAIQRRSVIYYIATGILFGLAVLTKSIAIMLPVFYIFWHIYFSIKNKNARDLKFLLVTLASFLIISFVFFPALWVKPIYYATLVFTESERIGLRRGHEQLLFGSPTNEASLWFYPLILSLKTSPFLLIGVGVFLFYAYRLTSRYKWQINSGFVLYLALFLLMYLGGISLASKKIDRYILVIYPMLAVFSYYGYVSLAQVKNIKILLIGLFLGFVIYPLIKFFPFYFTYTSPLYGSPALANQVVGQKPFGVGIYDLKQYIFNNYGYPRLGFIDTKPIEAIYANSKVFDIRVNGASAYDYIVLGINEEMPDNLINKFKKDSSMYINELEYWRIYEKQK